MGGGKKEVAFTGYCVDLEFHSRLHVRQLLLPATIPSKYCAPLMLMMVE